MIALKKITLEKNKIKNKCECKGKGCVKCYNKLIYVDKLVDYWSRSIKNFYGDENFKKFLLNYIKNINDNYDKGLTYLFNGERGRGKTFGLISILKYAILSNYSVIYFTLSDIVNNGY